MPVRGNTFKIFIGNLSEKTTNNDLQELFQPYGTVVEADAVKNYGFVHMENETEGKAAIEALKGTTLHQKVIAVEASTGSKKASNQHTKIFVGNLHKDTTVEEVRNLFQTYGKVTEADILTNYAFLHMEQESNALEAIKNLDGYELHGLRIRVQESTSRVRQQAGMGNPDMCYRCGSAGHWSKECPRDTRFQRNDRGGGRSFGGNRFDPYHMPPQYGGRDRMMRGGYRDDYNQYGGPRSGGGGGGYDRFYEDTPPTYDRRYGGPPPPPPPMHNEMYDRRQPPAPRNDYIRYGRRSPQRYPPPPPMMNSFGGPPVERRPY